MRYITPELVMRNRFLNHPAPRWDVAVLCFRGAGGSAAMVRRLDAQPYDGPALWGIDAARDCPKVHQSLVRCGRVCIVSRCVWGAPQAAILVEELSALGVKHIVGFGAAGSLVPGLSVGTQVVAMHGLVTDGTSRAYTDSDQVQPDPSLRSLTRQAAEEVNLQVAPAIVATVDAVYRETQHVVREWRSLGANAINMETSALYAASNACGVKSIWLGHISDCLVGPAWQSWDAGRSAKEVGIEIVARLLERLPG